jgi:predicted GIY-YIG superfamily endonuclease
LQSKKDKSFYVGFSKNPHKRLHEHNQGRERYTKGHAPYEIVYVERFVTIKEAKDRENVIKKMKNIRHFLKKQMSFPDSQ